jgi:hypothetical protein
MANVNDHRKLRQNFRVRLTKSEDQCKWLKLVCEANSIYWHPDWEREPVVKVADTVKLRLHLMMDKSKNVELPLPV